MRPVALRTALPHTTRTRHAPALCCDRTCATAVQSYSCLLGNTALQAKELCDALRRDVVASTLDRTIENHAQVLKQVATPWLSFCMHQFVCSRSFAEKASGACLLDVFRSTGLNPPQPCSNQIIPLTRIGPTALFGTPFEVA